MTPTQPQNCRDIMHICSGVLYSPDAQEYEVDWGSLVPGRGAKVVLQRWRLMRKRVPDYLEKGFAQQLDWIVDSYAPQLRQKLLQQVALRSAEHMQLDAAN